MIEELTEKLATLDKDKVYKLSHACIVFNKITRRWWVHENDYGKYHTSYSIGAIPLLAGINFYI
jgi:hypothetical protein